MITTEGICRMSLPEKDEFISEKTANYDWKYSDPTTIRWPRVSGAKFVKPFEESSLKLPPKPLTTFNTTYHDQYPWKEKVEDPSINRQINEVPVEKSIVAIDPAAPGYYKHLDSMATTNVLTYVNPKKHLESIGINNAITYWNWNSYSKPINLGWSNQRNDNINSFAEEVCSNTYAAQCSKRRREFQTSVKFVPNKGLTSEMSENYKTPDEKIDFNFQNNRPILIEMGITIPEWTTESKMYGSKNPVQKFVNITDHQY